MRPPAPVPCHAGKEVIVTTNRKLGAAIALVTAIVAAVGLLTSFLNVAPAIGLALAGIVIGTGVAGGAFSATPHETKRN
jgi:hypothetical protein